MILSNNPDSSKNKMLNSSFVRHRIKDELKILYWFFVTGSPVLGVFNIIS